MPKPTKEERLAHDTMQRAPKTDFEKLLKERNAAQFLRDDICFIVGTCRADNPDIADKLEAILAAHQEIRCQDWM